MTYPNGREIEYGYGDSQSQNIDEVVDCIMSRLETISDSSGTLASYKYLGAGRIAVEDYAQSQVKLDYDPDGDNSFAGLDRFGRIHDQVWEQYHLEGGNEVVDGAVDEYIYGYDRAGNRVSKSNELDHDLDETYVYDNVDRLKEWYVGGSQTPSETWTLDSLGNNLGAGDYNLANEETPDTGSSGYDAAGNMITLRSGNSAIYDAWNRMTKVTTGSGENLTILQQNVYDGTNRRIQIYTSFSGNPPVAGTVDDDYYAGQQVIQSNTTTGGAADGGYQMIWSPRYIDAPIFRDKLTTDRSGIQVAERVFYTADANYNVTGLVKYNTGTEEWEVVERYTYTPYGVVTVRAGDTWNAITGNASQENNTILYTGRTVDLATGGLQNVDLAAGLMYYRARFYDAALERFINRDPIGYDVNLYRYCQNNSIEFTDPLGECRVGACEVKPVGTPTINSLTLVIRNLKGEIVSSASLNLGSTTTVTLKTLLNYLQNVLGISGLGGKLMGATIGMDIAAKISLASAEIVANCSVNYQKRTCEMKPDAIARCIVAWLHNDPPPPADELGTWGPWTAGGTASLSFVVAKQTFTGKYLGGLMVNDDVGLTQELNALAAALAAALKNPTLMVQKALEDATGCNGK